ncbi:MAG: hypothetical protein ABW195_04070 [Ilumatobacteraceae bacterium]
MRLTPAARKGRTARDAPAPHELGPGAEDPGGGAGPPALRRFVDRHPGWSVLLLTSTLWGLLFVRGGSVLALGAEPYLRNVSTFPRPFITGDPLEDYRSWSVLPIAAARLVQVSTMRGFALLQTAILVVGTAGVLGLEARRAPRRALVATLAVFMTAAPAYALQFVGSYDQLLVVLLLAAVLVRTDWAAVAIGVALGLTHAEVGFAALAMVLILGLAGVGDRSRPRCLSLLGLVVARVALQIWFSRSGLHSDRWTFIREYGVDSLAGNLLDVWPVVLWSMFGVGWVVVIRAFRDGDRRRRFALAGIAVLCLGLCAITLDQSRIAILTMFAPFLVVVLHLSTNSDRWFDPAPSGASADAPHLLPSVPLWLLTAASLLSPLVVAWVGRVYVFGSPFRLGW